MAEKAKTEETAPPAKAPPAKVVPPTTVDGKNVYVERRFTGEKK